MNSVNPLHKLQTTKTSLFSQNLHNLLQTSNPLHELLKSLQMSHGRRGLTSGHDLEVNTWPNHGLRRVHNEPTSSASAAETACKTMQLSGAEHNLRGPNIGHFRRPNLTLGGRTWQNASLAISLQNSILFYAKPLKHLKTL